jgi:hypothetical protein
MYTAAEYCRINFTVYTGQHGIVAIEQLKIQIIPQRSTRAGRERLSILWRTS